MSILLAGIHQINVAGAELKTLTLKDNSEFKLVSLILASNNVNVSDEDDDPYAAAIGGSKQQYENSLGFAWPKFDPETTITEYVGKSRETRKATRYDCYSAFVNYVNQVLTALAPASFSGKVSNALTNKIRTELFTAFEADIINKRNAAGMPAPNKPELIATVLELFKDYINENDEQYISVCEMVAESFVAKINELADAGELRQVSVKLLRRSKEINYGGFPYVNIRLKTQDKFIQPVGEKPELAFSNYERGLDKEGKPMLDKNGNPMLDRSSPVAFESTEVNAEEKAKQEETLGGVFTGFGMTN